MDDTVLKVALAGLLHDIGKFAQRAEVPLSVNTKGLESSICKLDKGHYTYRHVLWTNEFFELQMNHPHLGADYNQDSLSNLSAYHHNPSSKLQEIIQLADCLSSGSERQDDEETSARRDGYKKTRMHCIFDHMHLDQKHNPEKNYRYELRPMEGTMENCFPLHKNNLQPADGDNLTASYRDLWQGFMADLNKVEITDKEKFLTTMLSLLGKYTWCIPSSTVNRPDISLFDHAKTTAAIAACLYKHHAEKGDLETARFSTTDETVKFRLLVGDLSGIQDYIYNIKNVGVGGTAKRLRSRSFYLTALSDIASHALLRAFGTPLTNLVISSGGKFYLMLPDTPDAGQIITKFKRESASWLIRHLNGEVALNIADVHFSCKELMSFNQVLKNVNQALQKEKERAFSNVLMDESGWKSDAFMLSDRKFQEEESLCKSCRKFPGVHQRTEGIVLCNYCHDDIELGTDLAQAVGVQFFNNAENGRYKVFDGYSFSVAKDGLPFSAQAYLIQTFNHWEFDIKNVALRPRPFANSIPIFNTELCHKCGNDSCRDKENAQPGSPKYFTCLAHASDGRKMLGVLKADVDYLGLIFIAGFAREEEKCISRITTLSRLLENFFTGRLQYLLQNEFPDIYTVYAGGDDLLMIGPWSKMLDFADRVNSEFGFFTCGNPAFSLSAGIGLMHAHLPVYSAVSEAEDLLKKAKQEKAIDEALPKQQLAVFGDIVKWKRLPSIHHEARKLAQWQEDKKVSMGFVRLLLNCSESFLEYKKEGRTSHLRFIPMLSYSIARNISAKETDVLKWSQDLTNLQSENLRHLAFIANYSIQTNRS